MKPTWSPHWDELCKRAVSEARPDLIKHGREMELSVMGFVLFPARIQSAWDDGQWSILAYLAEFIAAGLPPGLEKTDVVLYKNMTEGLNEIRRLGWDRKLDPVALRNFEKQLEFTILNQRSEGHTLTEEEILKVRRNLTLEHLK